MQTSRELSELLGLAALSSFDSSSFQMVRRGGAEMGLPNKRVNLSVRAVTSRANGSLGAPARPSGHAQRWATRLSCERDA